MPVGKGVSTAVKSKESHPHHSLKDRVARTFHLDSENQALVDELYVIEETVNKAKDEEDNEAKRRFNMVMSFVVMVNIFLMGLEAELQYGKEVSTEENFDFWWYVELVFLIIFVFEICVRIAWEGRQWRRSRWNLFDAFCLAPSFLCVASPMIGRSAGALGLLNMLRLLKLLRLVRSLKVANKCEELYLVLLAWWRAMIGIAYVVVLIIFGLFVFSLVSVDLIGLDPDLKDLWLGDRTTYELYGSVSRAMYTLFVMMSLQGFEVKTRALVEKRPVLLFYWIGFVMVFTFGLVNMLVAQVVERVLAETQKLQFERATAGLSFPISKLKELFEALDKENAGSITRSAFESRVTESEDIKKRFLDIGFPLCHMRDFFNIVDQDGDGILEEEEFFIGCLTLYTSQTEDLQEVATHAYVRALDHRVEHMAEAQTKLGEQIERQMDMLKKLLDAGSSCPAPDGTHKGTPMREQLPAVEELKVSFSSDVMERMSQEMHAMADHIKLEVNNMWHELQWKESNSQEKTERAMKMVRDQLLTEITNIGNDLRLELRASWEDTTSYDKIDRGRGIVTAKDKQVISAEARSSASQYDARNLNGGRFRKGLEVNEPRVIASLYELMKADQAHKA